MGPVAIHSGIEMPLPLLIVRSVAGGVLMGLANLVPGISGGTMLLAAGIYPFFINGIAEVSTLKFRARSLVVLGCVVVAAGAGILLLAGTVKGLVIDHRWIMYSLFIGLTLGGVPIVWKMIGSADRRTWVGVVCGFVGMSWLAYVQQAGSAAVGADNAGWGLLFAAGIAGASAMILPGVSGGYLLLVLGVYVPILTAIDRLKDALSAMDVAVITDVGVSVVIPVGLGVVAGIVGVSNLLKVFLRKYEQVTLGVLLGLLLGAVIGLWPFQQGVMPEIGDLVKGQAVTAESLAEIEPEDFPTEFFAPSAKQVAGALALVIAGFLATFGISRFGGDKKTEPS